MCCSAPSFSQIFLITDKIFLRHRTLPSWTTRTVHFLSNAPYISSTAFLCGAYLLSRTAHILRSFSVRCLFAFPHRTHSPQLFCAVPVRIFAPHISSTAFMYGAFLNFRTVHFLHISSIRCLFSFPHRTLPEKSPHIQLKKHFAREMLARERYCKAIIYHSASCASLRSFFIS